MNTILIVDDEASVRKTISDILVYYGYETLAVDCGQKAINLIKKETPDLVLLDIMLEDMSGIDVLREIKKEEEYTEFIILTGNVSQEAVVEAINLGAYGYIQKPYSIDQLLIMIKRAIEKQNTRKELFESEKRYRTLFDSVNDAIFIYDLEGTFLEVNHIACDRFGYKREEFLHMTRSDIHLHDDVLKLEEIISVLHEKGQFYFETIHVKRNGTVIPTEVNCRLIDYKDREAILSSARDITKRKETEHLLIEEKERTEKARKELEIAYNELKSAQSRILQSEKMASIGQLAAGIAHEINNPIGFIGGNLRSLEKYINKFLEFMEAQSDVIKEFKITSSIEELSGKRKKLKIDYITEDIKELIKESLDGTERVAKIVQDLKSFSRLDEGAALRHADINESIDRTLNIVWNEIKYKARVIKEYGVIPQIKCYPQQLTQVFMNLLVNASQAIEKEGEIFIKTWHDGDYVCISIGDTGCGIKEEHLNKIFEPFFTTKEVGAGTGLGLSIIYDIIKKHKGDITVESTAGKGTVFTVKIPVEVSSE